MDGGTLVLDLDGTLVDTLPDLLAALNRLAAAEALAAFTADEIRPMIGDGARVLVERAYAARSRAFDPGAADRFVADYTGHAADASRPFPGALSAIETMSRGGWRFAVCTNKPEAASRALLDALDLTRHLAAIGGGDSFATRKPDPGHLLGTIALAGGEASRAVMVGDHANDVRAAAGAGVPCVFAAWGYGAAAMGAGAAAVARDFADVPSIAEGLLGRA